MASDVDRVRKRKEAAHMFVPVHEIVLIPTIVDVSFYDVMVNSTWDNYIERSSLVVISDNPRKRIELRMTALYIHDVKSSIYWR